MEAQFTCYLICRVKIFIEVFVIHIVHVIHRLKVTDSTFDFTCFGRNAQKSGLFSALGTSSNDNDHQQQTTIYTNKKNMLNGLLPRNSPHLDLLPTCHQNILHRQLELQDHNLHLLPIPHHQSYLSHWEHCLSFDF